VAAEPPHLGEHLPQLPDAGARVVGTAAGDALQRRLPPPHRREASRGAGTAGSRVLAGDLARHRSNARRGALAGRVHLLRRSDAPAGAEGLSRGVLLHLLLQPDPRRGRRGRRRLLLGGGDDVAGARRPPDPHAAPAGGDRLGGPHRGGRARDVDGDASGQRGRRSWALYQELGEEGPEPPVSVGLERPEVEALAPVLPACAERVRETRSAQDLPSSAGEGARPGRG
jgi:hypothetical protein